MVIEALSQVKGRTSGALSLVSNLNSIPIDGNPSSVFPLTLLGWGKNPALDLPFQGLGSQRRVLKGPFMEVVGRAFAVDTTQVGFRITDGQSWPVSWLLSGPTHPTCPFSFQGRHLEPLARMVPGLVSTRVWPLR